MLPTPLHLHIPRKEDQNTTKTLKECKPHLSIAIVTLEGLLDMNWINVTKLILRKTPSKFEAFVGNCVTIFSTKRHQNYTLMSILLSRLTRKNL